jgi:RND family efflux transporter MFP subunit
MSSHRTRVVLTIAGAAALLALGVAVTRSSGPGSSPAAHGDDGPRMARPARPVVVVAPETGGASETIVVPGRVRAREEAVLTATIGGRLTALAAEGESFRRGDRLAAFEASEMRQALASAEAAHRSAVVQSDVARRQSARVDSLFDRGVASRRQEEETRAAHESAEAAEAGARAQLALLSEGARVAAPFDGVVVRRLLDPGSTVAAGTPLISIRSDAAADIEAAVPESRLAAVGGAGLEVQVGDGPWRAARLVRAEGMTDPATRTRLVRVALLEEAALPAGAFARVRFTMEARVDSTVPAEPHAPSGDDDDDGDGLAPGAGDTARLFLPESVLVRRGALIGVYIEESGRAHLAWLRVGRTNGKRVEILAGLSPSDRVITEPAGLADGDPVSVR